MNNDDEQPAIWELLPQWLDKEVARLLAARAKSDADLLVEIDFTLESTLKALKSLSLRQSADRAALIGLFALISDRMKFGERYAGITSIMLECLSDRSTDFEAVQEFSQLARQLRKIADGRDTEWANGDLLLDLINRRP